MNTEPEPCEACYGVGATYQHKLICDSDFCVGNGDYYDCGGTWEPCEECGGSGELPIEKRIPINGMVDDGTRVTGRAARKRGVR